ncbi:MAG: non-homologous end-joining DNA ligase [Bacteriovoracia bacterium]
MSLETYQQKRNFEKTQEPKGGIYKEKGSSFVIHEHHAKRLHYDLRLELDGVLKSWAVPKGPSINPKEKRLAIAVEDHPLEYADFEGEIPKGQYGAGKVFIWDNGNWECIGDAHNGLKKGKLEFIFHGQKLTGKWSLIKLKNKQNEWLLIKSSEDKLEDSTINASTFFEPSLATLTKNIPNGETWVHEIKLDGYRIQAIMDGTEIYLKTRKGLNWSEKFPLIHKALFHKNIKGTVLDGEIIHLDTQHHISFGKLQEALKMGNHNNIVFYVFDIPFYRGQDLRDMPLLKRKEYLLEAIKFFNSHRILYCDHFEGIGEDIFEHICGMDLEGVVSKRKDSSYESGRTKQWLKIKCVQRQEFVIVGFTESKKHRSGFGSLLLGLNDKNHNLHYVGKVGTGFSKQQLIDLRKTVNKLKQKESPLKEKPQLNDNITWITPKLVAEISFNEWTENHLLRTPSFMGLREDLPADEIVESTIIKAPQDNGPQLTNTTKILYPKFKLTKQDLVNF